MGGTQSTARSDVTDAPSPGELSRRIDHVTMSLTQLVQRAEFTAEQRIVDRRLVEVEADITAIRIEIGDLRRQLAADFKELKGSIDAVVARQDAAAERAAEKRGSNLRQAVYAGLLPAVLLLLSIAVQIWLAQRGA